MTSERAPHPDGPGACPFVAFGHDRDHRSARPDHRHRCFAEVRPAPRALAHQEAYCLALAYAACPTFQDWARREAASALSPAEEAPAVIPGAETPAPGAARWTSPPPWLAGHETLFPEERPAEAEPGGQSSGPAARGAGERPLILPEDEFADESDADLPPFLAGREAGAAGAHASHLAEPGRLRRRPVAGGGRGAPPGRVARDAATPSWERPRRYEAYPHLRSRIGFPAVPRLAIAAAALLIAAVALFFLPTLFSGLVTGERPTPSPTPRPSATASSRPTPTPAPTAQVYIVKANDTLSEIAEKFGVTVSQLLAANPQITDANRIVVGQKIYIPGTGPVPVPGSPTPDVSPGEGSPAAETPLP